ncbi:MAG: nucleotidyltransferase domain-containing protein [Nanoarchaeota archaeon]|nr:nucleotidyltransferase domain-containing protein [Nanoarchaeota archaeon]
MLENINIAKIFLTYPTREFNVREIARMSKVSPPTASKILNKLKRKGFLKVRKERIMKLYSANLESNLYRDTKVYFNIRTLRESGLISFLNTFYLKPTIVLFGSAARGMDTETSDFDLLIISERKEVAEIKKFEKKIKRSIQLFVVDKISSIKNKHLINNIVNGITIQGEIKWI